MGERTDTTPTLDRADFLKTAGAGALVVAFGMPTLADVARAATGASGPYPELLPTQLDSWLVLSADNVVTVLTGKNDNGQGVDVALGQIVAEELDLSLRNVRVVQSDTGRVLDQGGASNASGIWQGGVPLRNAAAEARRVLLELASKQWGVAASGLDVVDGVVSVRGDSSRRATYGSLLGGRRFDVRLTSNNALGNGLNAQGVARPKDPRTYRLVGTSPKRPDIEKKAFATFVFTGDVRLPGLLHARVVRPPAAGAKVVRVDGFARRVPGVVRVLVEGDDFVAVVCEREEQAIRASRELRVAWSSPAAPPFSTVDGVYDHIRAAAPRSNTVAQSGNIVAALAGAAKVVEAQYEWPFQSHASMAPAVTTADVQPGNIRIWSGTQKTAQVQSGVAELLGVPKDTIRVIWVQGPGSYGRNDADDCALEAALISQRLGRPVRLQWMRHEGTGWDPKGPATVITMRGGLDAAGNPLGWDYDWKGFSGQEVGTSGALAGDTLIGQTLGFRRPVRNTAGTPADSYGFPHRRTRQQVIEAFMPTANPLRSAHMRDPQGPQSTFASESFMDELAAAAAADPVEFRLRMIREPRDRDVVQAAARASGWESRPAARRVDRDAKVLRGRGIAYAQRGPSRVATVAEVEVTRATGRVWVRRVVCAIDAGTVINPDGLRNVVEGNVIQSLSRTLKEEVRFSRTAVTSVDWETYPILNMAEIPESVETVIVNNLPEHIPASAGEPPTRPTAAAVANAIYDATGVRLRRVPFTPPRVRAALRAAGL